MRQSLESVLPWCTGPMPDLCMGVLAIALGDTTIPVEERREFLHVVLQASPSEEHRAELEDMVIEALQAGHFRDLISSDSVQDDRGDGTVAQ